MLRAISPLEFQQMLSAEKKPLLFAFMRKDAGFRLQIEAVEEACRGLEDKLEVYLLDADQFPSFWERHGFRGTPAFAIYLHGRKQATLLGRATAQMLGKLLLDYLEMEYFL